MAKTILMNGETHPGVSEVELPVSGGTALFRDVDEIPEAPETPEMPSSWWELTGGASSKTGPVTAAFHGTTLTRLGGGYDLFWVNMDITVDNDLEEIAGGGLQNVSSGLTMHLISDNNFANLTTIGNEAFRSSGLTVANFPAVNTLGSNGGQFAQCKMLTEINLPMLTSWPRNMAYNMNNTVLTSVQIGSVGHPITVYPSGGDFGGATNANLTITLYTTPDKAADMRTAFTAGNATATIVIKDASTDEVIA